MKTILSKNMNRHAQATRWMISAASMVFAAGMSLSSVQGEVIYQNGFEASQNYSTTGGSLSNGNISGQGGGGTGSPLQNWSSGGSTELKIVTSTTSGETTYNPPQGSQMFQAQYGTGSTTAYQIFESTNNSVKESFTFSFKLAVIEETVSNAAIYIGVGNSSSSTGGMDFGLLRYGTGSSENPYVYGFAARQSDPGGQSHSTRIGTDTFSLNEFHTFTLTLDWETLTFSGTVYDASDHLVTSFSNVAMWDRDGVFPDIGFNRIGVFIHQKGNTPYFLIDDMSLTTIPEPSAVALVFVGALGLLFFYRRSRFARG